MWSRFPVPAHGRGELVIRAKTDPHDCVAMAGERVSDTFCWSVIDADIPFGVTVGRRTRHGEEDHAGAGGLEDMGAEVAEQAAADTRIHTELGFDIHSPDKLLDVFSQHALVV